MRRMAEWGLILTLLCVLSSCSSVEDNRLRVMVPNSPAVATTSPPEPR